MNTPQLKQNIEMNQVQAVRITKWYTLVFVKAETRQGKVVLMWCLMPLSGAAAAAAETLCRAGPGRLVALSSNPDDVSVVESVWRRLAYQAWFELAFYKAERSTEER